MPPYIVEPVLSQGPVAGQANQSNVTIPCIIPGWPCYSFGRLAGYSDAPTQNTEIGETLVLNAKGLQFAIRSFPGMNQNSPAFGVQVLTPTAPTTFAVTIQGAFTDIDAEYFALPAEAPDFTPNPITAPGSFTFPLGHTRVNFVRGQITTLTGSGTIVVKFIF